MFCHDARVVSSIDKKEKPRMPVDNNKITMWRIIEELWIRQGHVLRISGIDPCEPLHSFREVLICVRPILRPG